MENTIVVYVVSCALILLTVLYCFWQWNGEYLSHIHEYGETFIDEGIVTKKCTHPGCTYQLWHISGGYGGDHPGGWQEQHPRDYAPSDHCTYN